MADDRTVPGSFRDPSGFVFVRNGILYRQVNQSYRDHYDRLMQGGLYAALVESSAMVAHEEVDAAPARPETAHRVLKPEMVPLVSYPYEWCPAQLRDAALLTLEIQQKAVAHGMSLKDASAFNIQFLHGRPVFIDTLSFEPYEEGRPWVAYRQFCEHFLAPLALAVHRDVRLLGLLRVHLDGVPLDLTSSLLPFGTRFNPALLAHVHLHAKSQSAHAGEAVSPARGRMSKLAYMGLMDQLASCVKGLVWRHGKTVWGDYYDDTNYSDEAFERKRAQVGAMIERVGPSGVWDLGGNTGVFSRLASDRGIPTVCFDMDPLAVERNYLEVKRRKERHLLPLVLDLTNPTPALGWMNRERNDLTSRGTPDLALALALVHHLAIGNNTPLPMIADFFSGIAPHLVIEFVPKADSQVKRLLASREDVFTDYHADGFEAAFATRYTIEAREPIAGTERTLYHMRRKVDA